MVVPLRARGATLGALTLISAESRRRYSQDDLALAEDLARRCALAVDNARLYRQAREAERRKDESLALLDTLFAQAPAGLAFLDRDLGYVRINQALAAINGLPVEEHIGRRPDEVLPDIGDGVAEAFRRVLASGEPAVDMELSGQTPAAPGTERHWLASIYPVSGRDGHPLGVGCVVTDVTERK